MNEQDRKLLNKIRDRLGAYGDEWPESMVIGCLGIIDRLSKQLTEVKEAGEPFRKVAARIEAHLSDCWIIYSTSPLGDGEIVNLQVGDIRRLDKALKEVKDE